MPCRLIAPAWTAPTPSTPPTWTPTTTTKRSRRDATTDAPDGTHREERRITRTTHHPHGKGDQKAGTQKAGTQVTLIGAAEIIDVGEPETHTTTIRTVTRTVTDPPRRAPRTRLFRTLSKYRGEKNLAAWEERSSRPMFVASVLYLLAFAAPIMSTRIQEPYDGYLNIIQMILWGLFAADYCVRLYLAPRRSTSSRTT